MQYMFISLVKDRPIETKGIVNFFNWKLNNRDRMGFHINLYHSVNFLDYGKHLAYTHIHNFHSFFFN